MVVKENEPELYPAIALLFEQPPWLKQEQSQEYQVHPSTNKGHGRREVLRRQCRRRIEKTGQVHCQMRYGITSLRSQEANAKQLELLWRRHWTIENRDH
jgi:hypothetical protein